MVITMKNKKAKIISLSLVLVAAVSVAVVGINGYGKNKPVENNKPAESQGSSAEPKENISKADYMFTSNSDYFATKPEDLADTSDIIVYGEYLGDKRTYANEVGRPVTVGGFSIEQVLKGDIQGTEIDIEYYGGKVSVEEYLKTQDEDSIKKAGFDKLTNSEREIKTVGVEPTKESVAAYSGQKYICYLSFNEETGVYFVLSDAYGMRPADDQNNFFNPENESYEPISLFE